jgi:transcriptional regulator with XRE-family HTH domain
MKAKGLSVYRLSARSGLDKTVVNKMLTGAHTGPLVSMTRLAKGLGVSLGSMFTELERDFKTIKREDGSNGKSQQ